MLKQFKILHQGGYSDDEREMYKACVWCNTVESMQVLLRGMALLEQPIAFPEGDEAVVRGGRTGGLRRPFATATVANSNQERPPHSGWFAHGRPGRSRCCSCSRATRTLCWARPPRS